MKIQFETISITELARVDGGTFRTALDRGATESSNGAKKGAANGQAIAGPLGEKVGRRIGAVGGFLKGFGLDVWDDLRNR